MEYLGLDNYKFYLSDKEVVLTENDIETIINQYNKYNHNKTNFINLFDIEVNKREYNKSDKVKRLFKKYYTATKTKKEIFLIISKELNISIKAVDKAYYKK